MDCTDVKALLSAIVDGRLAADRRHDAERHLADCAACRSLVSDAERADALVAAAIGHDGAADTLPEGFEGAVLARTVYDDGRGGNRWRSWLGWLAAAATVVLAVVLWPLGRTTLPTPNAGSKVVTAIYPPPPELGSWTLEEPVEDTGPRTPLVVNVNEVARYAENMAGIPWEATRVPRKATAEAVARVATDDLSRDAAETIESVAMVLSILENADDGSFADVEQARRITEYEQLLPRLSEIRGELRIADRPVLLAAEAMLYRVVRGPMDLDDVRELRNTIAHLDLPDQIDALTGGRPRANSL